MAEEIKKKKGFFRKNGWVILLVLATGGVVATSFYDKDHEDMIEVTVDKGSEEERIQNNAENYQTITIFVYDKNTKTINEKEVTIPKQLNLVEGDFINEIIKNSDFINENMKFRSAYNLRINNVNTTVVKLNGEFLNLKKNPELFNGFSQAVSNTILKNFSNFPIWIIPFSIASLLKSQYSFTSLSRFSFILLYISILLSDFITPMNSSISS